MNHDADGTSNQTSVSMNFQNFVNNTRARSAHALAITSYQARERRYGRTSEQVTGSASTDSSAPGHA